MELKSLWWTLLITHLLDFISCEVSSFIEMQSFVVIFSVFFFLLSMRLITTKPGMKGSFYPNQVL